MKNTRTIGWSLIVVFLLGAADAMAQKAATKPAQAAGADAFAEAKKKLASGDPSAVQQGADEFRTVFEALVKHGFRSDNINSLKSPFDAKQYDLVYDLAL